MEWDMCLCYKALYITTKTRIVNNSYGWAMSQKLPVNGFKFKKSMLKFNEDFIKNYD